ncbi:hypothetical protein QJS10_CPA01g03017 [Acorus calamus]|uniref:Uncharacterized protein n=1 Tax=Acorus calamus TaxID=4465 RepID=A0AAV9FNA4_ACOCL|nr:hypothetical protein QJS10_CPA01g03017 [Acorus calamus]
MGNPRRRGSNNTAAAAAAGDDIHTAARNGDIMAVQAMCLSNPLAVNSRDRHSRTPLHLAAWSGQTEVVMYLCNNKADVGAAAMDNMGAIHFASQKGHTEIIRILLSSGVSVKATNRKGFMPLHYAIQGSHLDLIKYLVRKGASLSAKTKAGKTPLDLASDEVRAFVLECEHSFKNEGETKCNEELVTKELSKKVRLLNMNTMMRQDMTRRRRGKLKLLKEMIVCRLRRRLKLCLATL